MYAQVVVPSYKGPTGNGFTYEIPNGLEVKVGQLVVVPFGRRQELGIVLSTDHSLPTTALKIRPIDSILFEKPFLLPYQLELLGWMAKYYLAGIGNCANAMMPSLPRRIQGSTLHSSRPLQRGTLSASQTLVLVPTINNIPQTMALFPKSARPLVYHSDLLPQKKLEAWLTSLGGQADYVFGTRQAVFLPYTKLRKIIIINEHDDAYKDQRSPYYDTLTVAQKVAEITRAKIEVIDPTPRVTTHFDAESGMNLSLRSRINPNSAGGIGVKIVSMAQERKVGNKTAISDELKYQIAENLKNGGNTLLYLNKKKESGMLYCNSCKHQEALAKEPQNCPNCGSEQIFFASLNINYLARQVEKLFPKTKVNLISDNRSGLNPESPKGLTLSIDIATSAVFYKLLPKHYSLVAAIATDSTLNVPEYTAPEKTYALVTTLKRLTTKTLLLQTYNPDNSTLLSAGNSNFADFYREQIEQRKTLLYPPFSLLIKLVVKGKNDEKTQAKAEELAEKISECLRSTDYGLQTHVLGPFESYFRKTSKVYVIVIKIPLKDYTLTGREKAIESVRSALESANAHRAADQIVVDPAGLN